MAPLTPRHAALHLKKSDHFSLHRFRRSRPLAHRLIAVRLKGGELGRRSFPSAVQEFPFRFQVMTRAKQSRLRTESPIEFRMQSRFQFRRHNLASNRTTKGPVQTSTARRLGTPYSAGASSQ